MLNQIIEYIKIKYNEYFITDKREHKSRAFISIDD